MKESLFDKVDYLKEKFKNFFTHKKKLSALENYSTAVPFQHKDYLPLIRRCMSDGFLGEKEAEFLTYMIEKYEVNFLDWAHKTKWLKEEITRIAMSNGKEAPAYIEQLNFFDYNKKKEQTYKVSFEILAKQAMPMGRRV